MPDPHRHTVTDLPDLVAVIPYLIGHHPDPDGDLVVVALSDARVTTLARAALPSPADAPGYAHQLRDVLPDADELVIVGYGPDPAVTPVLDAFTAAGTGTVRAVRVTGGRVHPHTPAGSGILDGGTPVDPASPAVLALVVAGHTAAASRAALAARIAPLDGAARAAMTAATRDVAARAALDGPDAFGQRALGVFHALTASGSRPNDEQVAVLALLAHTPGGADILFGLLDTTVADTDRQAAIDLWTDITRRADPALAATPAALLGYLAWRDGGGPLARIAIDRALAVKPDHRIARLVARILAAGLPPSILDDLGDRPDRQRP